MALHHQPPEGAVVPVLQCLCCPCCPCYLTNDVPGSPENLIPQPAPGLCSDICDPAAKPQSLQGAAGVNPATIPSQILSACSTLPSQGLHPPACPGLRALDALKERPEMREGLSPPSSSARVASLRVSLPRAAAASSHCLRRVGYSLPVRVCRTLELVMSTARLASLRGTRTGSRDLQGALRHVPTPSARPGPRTPERGHGEGRS